MINWKEQWALHAPNFREGFAHITLGSFGALRLKPGPGFGDFSHPTTRLIAELLPRYVSGKKVIDIGCGSGILSLIARKFGAKSVLGIDIEQDAITHAKENALLNQIDIDFLIGKKNISFRLEGEVLLMNMIYKEQEEALRQYALTGIEYFISSGVLISQAEEYRTNILKNIKFQLIEQRELDNWVAFAFGSAPIS